ncbi:hypothetical protein DL95DRAFT_313987, partial [Leptodontidium sp. 2 PMI_412]
TYDHRLKRIGHPVRSAIRKLQIGRLVVGWVTTSEYLLLYVFGFFFFEISDGVVLWSAVRETKGRGLQRSGSLLTGLLHNAFPSPLI